MASNVIEETSTVFLYSGREDVPDNIRHVQVDSSVEELPENGFNERFDLITVELPPTLSRIGKMAFYCCTNLTTINFPSFISEIPDDAFQSCRSLTDVELPRMLESIGARAFFECESLTEIRCPPHLKVIGTGAFVHCRSLVSVDLPEGLQSIGDRAFVDCQSLEIITIPSGVSQIKRGTFSHCHSLTTVNFATGLELIGDGAFWCCRSLASIRIPATVDIIGNSAFLYCTSLVSVEFSEGIQVIRQLAFQNCESLVNIALPPSLHYFSGNTFEDCEKLLRLFPQQDKLVDNLHRRFDGLPIHKLCYEQTFHCSTDDTTAMLQKANSPDTSGSRVDCLGMTAFHILALSTQPSVDFFLPLLHGNCSKVTLVDEKDSWGNCPMDYLCGNQAPNAIVATRDIIKVTTQNRVKQLGLKDWRRDVTNEIEKLIYGDVVSARRQRIHRIYWKLLRYERLEALSLLELALWNRTIDEAQTTMNDSLDDLHRRICRINCGVDTIVSNVLPFLGDIAVEMSFQSSSSSDDNQ